MIISARRSPCDESPEDSPNGLLCESCPLKLIDVPCPPLPSRISKYPSQQRQKRSDRQSAFWNYVPSLTCYMHQQRPPPIFVPFWGPLPLGMGRKESCPQAGITIPICSL